VDDDDGEEKELMERLKKLSVPASDEEEEGKCPREMGYLEPSSHEDSGAWFLALGVGIG